MSSQIEIVGRVSGRRRWSVEQKLAILRDAFGPVGSVGGAIERHEVSSGQLYTWRRQAVAGTLADTMKRSRASFAEVEIRSPAMVSPPCPVAGIGQIGIELPSGVRLTVDGSVDAEALARVIGVLTR
jgi:transposase